MKMIRKKKRSVGRVIRKTILSIVLYFILIVFIIVTAAAASAGLFAYNTYKDLKADIDKEVDSIDTQTFEATGPTTLYYWDKDTESWAVLDTLYTEESRTWLSYDEFPENLVNAAVAIEDKTFWEHKGVNLTRTIEATFNYIVRHQTETAGGSTITQQVIKNLTGNNSVSAERKFMEILEAFSFEEKYSKEEIMEMYLNNIYLGSSCYGVYAAAHKFFDKDVSELTLTECACIVSLTNNPSYYDPYRFPEHVKYRAALVLNQMCEQGYISETVEQRSLEEIGYQVVYDDSGDASLVYEEELDTFTFKDGSPDYEIVTDNSGHIYSWYEDAVLDAAVEDIMEYYDCDKTEANELLYTGGLSIYTTFDPDVQAELDEIYSDETMNEDHISEDFEDGEEETPPQSACVVLSNETGACIAMVGGTGEKETSRSFNRATDMTRQPGSSIKPLSAYAPAIEEGLIDEDTYIEDSPFEFDYDDDLTEEEQDELMGIDEDTHSEGWPVNAYGGYNGYMSVLYALTQSCNTIAVKVVDMLGVDKSYEWLTEKFHLTTISETDKVYAALALGGLTKGVTVYEMANAFSTFARDGVYTEAYLYGSITDIDGNVIVTHGEDAETILSEDTVEQMDDMLHSNTLFGTAENADVDGVRCAGKTGTTTDDKDVWFCGYTKTYTVAVWTGYDDNKSVKDSYPNPSCDTWHNIIEAIEPEDD